MTQAIKVLNGGIVFQVLLELAMASAQIQMDQLKFSAFLISCLLFLALVLSVLFFK